MQLHDIPREIKIRQTPYVENDILYINILDKCSCGAEMDRFTHRHAAHMLSHIPNIENDVIYCECSECDRRTTRFTHYLSHTQSYSFVCAPCYESRHPYEPA